MVWQVILLALAVLSALLTLWQWLAAWRFPLHQRAAAPVLHPPVSLLKPLKGCDEATAECLLSWLNQEYAGKVQTIFGVESADDPVCAVVKDLMKQFSETRAELVICDTEIGVNPKVSKLAHLFRRADHDHLVISDADVLAPPDLLANLMQPLGNEQAGLVSCLYRQAGAVTAAMQCEAVACNADFWSQVLQSRTIRPLDFALGAVMATRKRQIEEMGGFESIADCLADDYQLGQRIARTGHRIELSPIVVECRSGRMGWSEVWRHQLRWARTIRVCQPIPYFFSILSNGTVWPLLLMALLHHPLALAVGGLCFATRLLAGHDLQRRLLGVGGSKPAPLWMIPVKDILQLIVWALAFAGNRIDWRDKSFRLRKDGTLRRLDPGLRQAQPDLVETSQIRDRRSETRKNIEARNPKGTPSRRDR